MRDEVALLEAWGWRSRCLTIDGQAVACCCGDLRAKEKPQSFFPIDMVCTAGEIAKHPSGFIMRFDLMMLCGSKLDPPEAVSSNLI